MGELERSFYRIVNTPKKRIHRSRILRVRARIDVSCVCVFLSLRQRKVVTLVPGVPKKPNTTIPVDSKSVITGISP